MALKGGKRIMLKKYFAIFILVMIVGSLKSFSAQVQGVDINPPSEPNWKNVTFPPVYSKAGKGYVFSIGWYEYPARLDYELVDFIGLDTLRPTWGWSINWSQREIGKGNYNFTDTSPQLGVGIKEASKWGKKVFLIVGFFSYPPYYGKKFYSIHGARTSAGNLMGLSTFDKETRKRLARFLKAMAEHYKDNPNVLGYTSSNEFCFSNNAQSRDYSNAAKDSFRKYLKKKYKTISNLNAQWGTTLHSWEDIEPPQELPTKLSQRPRWYDWSIFKRKGLTDFMNFFYQTIRSVDKKHWIAPSIPGSVMGSAWDATISGLDTESIASVFDAVVFHGSPTLWQLEYMRSISKGKPMGNDEYYWNAPDGWMRTISDKDLSWVARRGIMAEIGMGVKLLNFFGWTTSSVGKFNSNMCPGRFPKEVRPSTLEIKRTISEVRQYEPYLFNNVLFEPKIAILEPSASIIQMRKGMPVNEAGGFFSTLQKLQYRCAFITESRLVKGEANRYQVLIIPQAKFLAKKVADKIREYVNSGGHIIATGACSVADEYGHTDRHLQLRDLFRADYGGKAKFARRITFTKNCFGIKKGTTIVRPANIEAVKLKPLPGGRVVAEYDTGGAAMVVNPGKTVLAGFSFGQICRSELDFIKIGQTGEAGVSPIGIDFMRSYLQSINLPQQVIVSDNNGKILNNVIGLLGKTSYKHGYVLTLVNNSKKHKRIKNLKVKVLVPEPEKVKKIYLSNQLLETRYLEWKKIKYAGQTYLEFLLPDLGAGCFIFLGLTDSFFDELPLAGKIYTDTSLSGTGIAEWKKGSTHPVTFEIYNSLRQSTRYNITIEVKDQSLDSWKVDKKNKILRVSSKELGKTIFLVNVPQEANKWAVVTITVKKKKKTFYYSFLVKPQRKVP